VWYFDINFDCFMALERTIWLSWQWLVVLLLAPFWPFGAIVPSLAFLAASLNFNSSLNSSSLLGNK